MVLEHLSESKHAKENGMKNFKCKKKKGKQLRILHPGKLSFKSEGNIKKFSDKQNRKFITCHERNIEVFFSEKIE